jgi:ribonuclease HII
MGVSLAHERSLWDAGATIVAGIDEVGRGALAGPVSVGVVALGRCDEWPDGLADSKQLTAARRELMAGVLAAFGAARAVGHASNEEIDALGIVGALRLAALRALEEIASTGIVVDAILLDGKHDWLSAGPLDLFASEAAVVAPVTMVVGGDGLCASIAAGSVLAKVARDSQMRAAHDAHREYGWVGNKGYGAPEHLDALRRLGPTPLHRVSWRLPGRS